MDSQYVQAEIHNEIQGPSENSKETDESSQDQSEESSCNSNQNLAIVGTLKAPAVSHSTRETSARVRCESHRCTCCSSFIKKESLPRQPKTKNSSSSISVPKSALRIKAGTPEAHNPKSFDNSQIEKLAEETPGSPEVTEAQVETPHQIKPWVQIVKRVEQEQDQDWVEKARQRALFGCKICSFKTLYVDNMRKHHRVHTGERPFKCSTLGCNYRARWVQNLRRHQQRRSCQGSKTESKATISDTQENLRSEPKKGNKTQLDVESHSSNKMTFACMLCNFIGDSESSAWEHARQHKIPVICLSRIH